MLPLTTPDYRSLWMLAVILWWVRPAAANDQPTPYNDLCTLSSQAEFEALDTVWPVQLMDLLLKKYRTDSVLAILKCLEPFALRDSNSVDAGKLFFIRANTQFQKHEMDESLADYRRAIAAFTAAGDSSQSWYAEAFQMAGELGARLDVNFLETIDDHQRAIELYQYQRDTFSYLWTVHTLAQIYGRNQFFALAKRERQLIFAWPRSREYPLLLSVANLVAAGQAVAEKDYDVELHHLREVEKVLKQVDNRQLDFQLHGFYFMRHYRREEGGAAGARLDSLEVTAARMGNNPRSQEFMVFYRSCQDYLEGNYLPAERGVKSVLASGLERKNYDQVLNCYDVLTNIYRKTSRPELALTYAERRFTLKDSLVRAAKLKESIYYENLFAAATRRQNEELRRAELSGVALEYDARVRTILGSVLFIIFTVVAAYLWWQSRQQRQFSRDLLLARTQERQRIALDLHDSVGHETLLLLRDAQAREDEELQESTGKLLDRVREISHELYAPGPEELGIRGAVEQLVARHDRNSDVFFSTEIAEEWPPLPAPLQHHLFAIIQEALQNVIKHAGAQAVLIKLHVDAQHVKLTLSDNGKGFSVLQTSGGLGLRSIRERTAILKGRLTFKSIPGEGTHLSLSLPL